MAFARSGLILRPQRPAVQSSRVEVAVGLQELGGSPGFSLIGRDSSRRSWDLGLSLPYPPERYLRSG